MANGLDYSEGKIEKLYDFTVNDFQGNAVNLNDFKGKVVLIVNTATKCGLTPQYEELQRLYDKYKDRGFTVLDFPSNQFLEQAPGSDGEINQFCTLNYNTTFPRFAKVDVNGKEAHPLFVWLKQQRQEDVGNEGSIKFEEQVKAFTPNQAPGDIKWNFGKFLINQNGNVVSRFSPAYSPAELEKNIEELLQDDGKILEAFQMMWGRYNEPVRLIHKSFRVAAGNEAYIRTGGKIGIKCPSVGTPDLHKGCRAVASLKDNETKITCTEVNGVQWSSYWVPVDGYNDYFIHFTNGLIESYKNREPAD